MWLDFSVPGAYRSCTGLLHSPFPQISVSRWLLRTLPTLPNFSAAKCVHLYAGLAQRDTAANADSQQWTQAQFNLKSSSVLHWNWRTKSLCWASWQVSLPGAVPTGRQGGEHTACRNNSGGREWAPLSRQLIVEYVMHSLGCELSLARASQRDTI